MTRLEELVKLLKQAPDEVFVQPHNVPDPDAIASAAGMQFLLKEKGLDTVIVYEDPVEKANSLKMLEIFDIEMKLAGNVSTLGGEDWTLLVDAQKGNANVTDLITDEVAVIDHHEYQGNNGYRFEDVRPEYGACSTIVAEYFFENNISPPEKIATALIYGIISDTDNLTRGISENDISMFYKLFRHADFSLINHLKGSEITLRDLHDYARAFQNVEVFGEIGFLRLDNANDSLLGAASDIILSIAGVNIVVTYSLRDTGIKFSLRSIDPDVSSSGLVRAILEGVGFGGGHKAMAGGFLPADKMKPNRGIDTFVRYRTISYVENVKKERVETEH